MWILGLKGLISICFSLLVLLSPTTVGGRSWPVQFLHKTNHKTKFLWISQKSNLIIICFIIFIALKHHKHCHTIVNAFANLHTF